jgi:hypothetical protein
MTTTILFAHPSRYDDQKNPIEFSAPVAGVDLRRHPRMADSRPSPIAREGPEPQPGHWPDPGPPVAEADRQVFPGEGRVLIGRRGKGQSA